MHICIGVDWFTLSMTDMNEHFIVIRLALIRHILVLQQIHFCV